MSTNLIGLSKRTNIMSRICKALVPLWVFGAFPVAFVTLITKDWDHRFGHPPIGVWIFAAGYALLGVLMFVGATRAKRGPARD